jgi:hypothetical protein
MAIERMSKKIILLFYIFLNIFENKFCYFSGRLCISIFCFLCHALFSPFLYVKKWWEYGNGKVLCFTLERYLEHGRNFSFPKLFWKTEQLYKLHRTACLNCIMIVMNVDNFRNASWFLHWTVVWWFWAQPNFDTLVRYLKWRLRFRHFGSAQTLILPFCLAISS